MFWRSLSCLLLCAAACGPLLADDPVFSGPQVGEALPPFKVVAVYGEEAGKEVDPVAMAEGRPTLLVFVHKLTRPGIALTKGLTNYAKSLEGSATGIVWLDDDIAGREAYLTGRAKGSLDLKVPVGISVDGGEGPGAYGLNRHVELTVLVADKNVVTANYALVQPSVTEGPRIVGELAKLLDKPQPTTEEFEKLAYPNRQMNMRMRQQRDRATQSPQGALREMMRKMIAADISEDDFSAAVKAIEKWVGDNDGRKTQLGNMATAVLERGMGGEKAQAQMKAWKKAYASESE